MTLYQELLEQTPNLMHFYRYEGVFSCNFFNAKNKQTAFNDYSRYIYFSQNIEHHKYYVSKRLLQLVSQKTENSRTSIVGTLTHTKTFNELITKLYNNPIKENIISLECNFSNIFEKLLYKNYVHNSKKTAMDKTIEQCDQKKYDGGFGFCEDWLRVFSILTYFYSYMSISLDDIVNYLYLYRKKLLNRFLDIDPTAFLLEKSRVVQINAELYSDYTKYELLNALQNIVEKGLYFPESSLAKQPQKEIKRVVSQYNEERQHILKLANSLYDKTLE